jgi:RHS repeat-associated protein
MAGNRLSTAHPLNNRLEPLTNVATEADPRVNRFQNPMKPRLVAVAVLAMCLAVSSAEAQTFQTTLGETNFIIPLGVPNSPEIQARIAAAPACATPQQPNCKDNISLAAFRIEVSLPARVATLLAENGKSLSIAIESERVPGALTPQSQLTLPRAHLRNKKPDGAADPRAVLIPLHNVIPVAEGQKNAHQRGASRFVSPWIIAIADPRASIDWKADKGDCINCTRPLHLKDATEATGVYELYTAGRTITVRPETGIFAGTSYAYLGDGGRLQARAGTVMADTVRPITIRTAARNPAIAGGLLQETLHLHSGEGEANALDLDAGGRAGWNVLFDRTYRSRTLGGSSLGAGWESSIFTRLRPLPNGDVELRDGGGEIRVFKAIPGGGYLAPVGLFLRLTRTSSGWSLIDQQWRVTTFDAFGRITSESDEWANPAKPGSGNALRYIYGGDGLLKQIVDPVDRGSNLTWFDDTAGAKAGLLRRIEDWRKRAIDFDYDTRGRLIEAALPVVANTSNARPTIRYTYDDDTARLKSIVNPSGPPARVTFAYANDKLTGQVWATGEAASINYIGANIIEVTDALQQLRRYTLTTDGTQIAKLEELAIPTSNVAFGALPDALDPASASVSAKTRTTTWTYTAGLIASETVDGIRVTTNTWKSVEPEAPGFILASTETAPIPAAAKTLSPSATETIKHEFEYQSGANAATFLKGVSAGGLKIDSPVPHRNAQSITAANDSINRTTKLRNDGLVEQITSAGGTDTTGAGANAQVTYEPPSSAALHARGLPKQILNGTLATNVEYPDADTIRETDPRGVVTTTKLDTWRRPLSINVTGPGLTLQHEFTYDINGNLKSERRRQGAAIVTTTHDYDAMNRLIATRTDNVAVDGVLTTIESTTSFNLGARTITTTNPAGAVTITTLDALGRPQRTKTETGAGPIESLFAYDLDDNVVYESNLQIASARAFDAHGREIASLAPDGTRTVAEFDAWGRPKEIRELDSGGVTNFEWTAAGRLASIARKVDAAQTRTTSLAWDGAGRTTGAATGDRASRNAFDLSGRMLSSAAGKGSATAVTEAFEAMTVDSHSGVLPAATRLRERGAAGEFHSATAWNTSADPVTQTLGPLEWQREFDEAGNMVASKDPARNEARYDVDARGSVTRETMPDAAAINHQYDEAGGDTRYADPVDEQTKTTNDLVGRPRVREYPDGTKELIEWDGPRLRSTTDRAGRVRNLQYNLKGQLIEIRAAGGEKLDRFAYDAAGRLSKWITNDAVIEWSDFDLDGNPGRTTQTRLRDGAPLDSYVQEHRWNEHGERVVFTMPAAPAGWTARVRQTYDAMGNLEKIERQLAGSSEFTTLMTAQYRNAGRPDFRTVNGTTRTYTYDSSTSLLTEMRVGEVGGTRVTYDGLQVSSATLLGVDQVNEWTYDARGRLKTANNATESLTPADFRAGVERVQTFDAPTRAALEAAGVDVNRIDPPSKTWTESPGHKIATFEYAGADRTEDDRNRYTYDARGRLVVVERKKDGARTRYYYDGLNRLVGRKVEVGTPGDEMPAEITFVWDRVTDTIAAIYDLQGNLLRQFIHGGLGYDDPIEVTVATPQIATKSKRNVIPSPFVASLLRVNSARDPLTTGNDGETATARVGAHGSAPGTLGGGGTNHPLPSGERVGGEAAGVRGAETRDAAGNVIPTKARDPLTTGANHETTVGAGLRPALGGAHENQPPAQKTQAKNPGETPAATPGLTRLYPIYDEPATGTLQLVLNEQGKVVSRHYTTDPYGELEFSAAGAAVERIDLRARKQSGAIDQIEVTIKLTESVNETTVPTGARLATIDDAGTLTTTHPEPPQLINGTTLKYTLTKDQWTTLTTTPPATTLSIAITNTLRANAFADNVPILPPPDWALVTKPVQTSTDFPVELRETLASLSSWLASLGADEETTTALYDVPALALTGTQGASEASRLLVASPFHGYPYSDTISELVYVRNRWYDATQGLFLTEDPEAYIDSSNLYAFGATDPVNNRDPLGEGVLDDLGFALRQKYTDVATHAFVTRKAVTGIARSVTGAIVGAAVTADLLHQASQPANLQAKVALAEGFVSSLHSAAQFVDSARDAVTQPEWILEALSELPADITAEILSDASITTAMLISPAAKARVPTLAAKPPIINPRHVAQATVIEELDATVTRLGERAVREGVRARSQGMSGVDAGNLAEATFGTYVEALNTRLLSRGAPFVIEWQPAMLPGYGRVPGFVQYGHGSVYPFPGSLRLDAALSDTRLLISTPSVSADVYPTIVRGYDITIDTAKMSAATKYQSSFGVPVRDIRPR